MIERLLRRTAGEVRVRVTGASLPRFLNACTQGGVRLRRMERVSWDRMDATLSLGDFRKLRSCMGRTGCRVHILKRHGVPFVLARLLPRTALLAGLAAFCVMAYLVGTRVWEINTDISPSLGEDAVMSKLASLGVDIGTPLRSIDTPSIRRQMMVWDPDITFFALNLRGNSLTVTAHAGAAAPEVADEAHPMRIVASHGGVVRQVRALRGEALVRAGDAVETGEVLIDSLVPPTRENGLPHTVRAEGTVEAYTVRRARSVRPLRKAKKSYYRKTCRLMSISIGKMTKKLYFGTGIAGGTCDKMIEAKTWRLSESVRLPVTVFVQTYRYYDAEPETVTAAQERTEMVRRALGAVIRETDGGRVLSLRSALEEKDGAAVLDLTVHAVEQIGSPAEGDASEGSGP